MGKSSGAANYKIAEIVAVLELIREHLPLGKDEWDRVSSVYNSQRLAGWPERDTDSIKRKFRQLYLLRKPTGNATIPEHVELAKSLKVAIDARAGVVDLDDGGDVDQENATVGASDLPDTAGVWTAYMSAVQASEADGQDRAFDDADGEDFIPSVATDVDPITHPQPNRGFVAGLARDTLDASRSPRLATAPSRDDAEASRYPRLATTSDRLGGGDLIQFRDDIQRKRVAEDGVPLDASFAKQKRVRAEKAVASMKKDLAARDDVAAKSTSDIFQLMLMLREESERKVEVRRADEDRRRREEQKEKDDRRREEKEEKEERRRQDKQDAEERAHARVQEMMLLISALAKK